ncbi:MAG TPA: adenylyl-sulfate kinase [Candidatus Bathyarchaeia archaeon]|nr:adenylyl-sulfate kinase [Candidatus Bathyarchaeia archaeon]
MREGFVVWLTGLPGSGKTTIARHLEAKLRKSNWLVEVLDGDEIRQNLSKGLGFSREDRETHLKRASYVAKLLSRNGVAVIAAFISPYRSVREYARKETTNFIEVFVKCSLQICAQRDPKGLYKKASTGEIKNLTGPQDVYEEPLAPDLVVETDKLNVEESVNMIVEKLNQLRLITDR